MNKKRLRLSRATSFYLKIEFGFVRDARKRSRDDGEQRCSQDLSRSRRGDAGTHSMTGSESRNSDGEHLGLLLRHNLPESGFYAYVECE